MKCHNVPKYVKVRAEQYEFVFNQRLTKYDRLQVRQFNWKYITRYDKIEI